MKIIETVKNFFTKPAMSFDKIIMLGICEFVLIFFQETFGRLYGLTGAIYNALFTTVLLALCVQLIRLIFEVKAGK